MPIGVNFLLVVLIQNDYKSLTDTYSNGKHWILVTKKQRPIVRTTNVVVVYMVPVAVVVRFALLRHFLLLFFYSIYSYTFFLFSMYGRCLNKKNRLRWVAKEKKIAEEEKENVPHSITQSFFFWDSIKKRKKHSKQYLGNFVLIKYQIISYQYLDLKIYHIVVLEIILKNLNYDQLYK